VLAVLLDSPHEKRRRPTKFVVESLVRATVNVQQLGCVRQMRGRARHCRCDDGNFGGNRVEDRACSIRQPAQLGIGTVVAYRKSWSAGLVQGASPGGRSLLRDSLKRQFSRSRHRRGGISWHVRPPRVWPQGECVRVCALIEAFRPCTALGDALCRADPAWPYIRTAGMRRGTILRPSSACGGPHCGSGRGLQGFGLVALSCVEETGASVDPSAGSYESPAAEDAWLPGDPAGGQLESLGSLTAVRSARSRGGMSDRRLDGRGRPARP